MQQLFRCKSSEMEWNFRAQEAVPERTRTASDVQRYQYRPGRRWSLEVRMLCCAGDRTRQVVVRRFGGGLIVIEPIVSQALRMDRSHETQLQLIRSRGLPEQSVQLGADVMNDPATASNDSQPAIFWPKSEI